MRAKIWVLGASALAIAVLSYLSYRNTWAGPQSYGWFAYAPLNDQVFYPDPSPAVAVGVAASLLPMVIAIGCVGMLALGPQLPRFNAGVVAIVIGAAVLTSTAAYLGRGGTWVSDGGSRRYADYLSDEPVHVIDLAGVSVTLQLASAGLLIVACALSAIGFRRSSREQPDTGVA